MLFLKNMTRKALNALGYDIVKEHGKLIYNRRFLSRYFNETSNTYLNLHHSAGTKAGTLDRNNKEFRLFTVYQAVHQLLQKNIPGDFVECGCFRGRSTYIISSILSKYPDITRDFLIFDSFEGLSEKNSLDRTELGNTTPQQTAREKKYFTANYDEVKKLLSPFPFVQLHKGWIPEVFSSAKKQSTPVAFLHIDVDLYEPTKASLEHFLPRMSKGGIIIVSNYGFSSYPGSKKATDEVLSQHKHSFFLENHLGGCIIMV